MFKSRNILASLLGLVVLATTVVVLLAIWEVIEIDVEHLLRKGLWSAFTVFIGAAIIVFIYNMLYRTPVKPPKPPGMDR